MENIFKIRDLKCKYPTNEYPVLEIDYLDIKSGSRTFFIGASGVGKSTVLETLGLMNNTIYNPNKSIFTYKNGFEEDFIKIWDKKEKDIAKFRSNNLSFIFQNTNLFDTLSAYENIYISVILEGKTISEAKRLSKIAIKKIIPNLTNDKPISQLSGGQRQRIAFARAIVSDFKVLFADEPTGNLDLANAGNLMNILMESVNNKTSIIVTHDIELATKYANKIVLINKEERITEDGITHYGKINDNYTYTNQNGVWKSAQDEYKSTNDFISFIKEILTKQAG